MLVASFNDLYLFISQNKCFFDSITSFICEHTFFQFFYPCCSTSGIDPLIEFWVWSKPFLLVSIPLLLKSLSYLESINFWNDSTIQNKLLPVSLILSMHVFAPAPSLWLERYESKPYVFSWGNIGIKMSPPLLRFQPQTCQIK